MSDIIASDFDGLAVLKDLDQTIQILAWNIGPACQVAEFMGTKWLAACRELDTESTGVKGEVWSLEAELHGSRKHRTFKDLKAFYAHRDACLQSCLQLCGGVISETQLPTVWGKARFQFSIHVNPVLSNLGTTATSGSRVIHWVFLAGEDRLCPIHRRLGTERVNKVSKKQEMHTNKDHGSNTCVLWCLMYELLWSGWQTSLHSMKFNMLCPKSGQTKLGWTC